MTSKTDLTKLGEVVSTDVLIIGGGIAGLLAAIKAGQARPAVNVLLVDKATPGYAGQGPRTGGVVVAVKDEQLEEWFKWKVEQGGYLNDQELVYAFGKDSLKVQLEMADWGAPYQKDETGNVVLPPGEVRDGNTSTTFWPSQGDMMQFLRGKARSEGVRILPRVMVVSLLMEGEKVAGAVGFSIDSGKFYILKAKATIIANGACMYRYRSWFQYNSGEGVAMAYNAGAEMRNADFANTTGYCPREGKWGGRGPGGGLENARGENLYDRYGIPREEGTPYEKITLAMYKEIQEGRGPIMFDVRKYAGRPGSLRDKIIAKMGLAPGEKIEYIIAQSAKQGPIRVDMHCRATVPGLWAVGDASFGGSAIFRRLSTLQPWRRWHVCG